MRTVHVVVPDGLDDPMRPTGGNIYDRRICDGLTTIGWQVIQHTAPVIERDASLIDCNDLTKPPKY